jgi:hypothetical protein
VVGRVREHAQHRDAGRGDPQACGPQALLEGGGRHRGDPSNDLERFKKASSSRIPESPCGRGPRRLVWATGPTITPASRAPPGELRSDRLLVAHDGADSADLALSPAVTAARRDRSTIGLLTVGPDTMAGVARRPAPGAHDPQTLQDEADADARGRLHEAVGRIPRSIPVTPRVRRGRAGEEIVAQTVVAAHVPSRGQAVASWS